MTKPPSRRTHGSEPWRLYRCWDAMLYRCRHERFARYAGRGITVCKAWHSFERFRDWALAHGYRDDLKLDRIDNDGNYTPRNCRWVTDKESARNTKNNRAVIRSDGRRFAVIMQAVEATPGSSHGNLIKACRGDIKTHAGFGWCYEECHERAR